MSPCLPAQKRRRGKERTGVPAQQPFSAASCTAGNHCDTISCQGELRDLAGSRGKEVAARSFVNSKCFEDTARGPGSPAGASVGPAAPCFAQLGLPSPTAGPSTHPVKAPGKVRGSIRGEGHLQVWNCSCSRLPHQHVLRHRQLEYPTAGMDFFIMALCAL